MHVIYLISPFDFIFFERRERTVSENVWNPIPI